MKKKLKELEKRIAALENKCVVDGCNNDVMQEHHIITVVSGDVTREQPFDPITNPMLRLCDDHHDAIHEVKKNKGGYRSNELIKTGIAKYFHKPKVLIRPNAPAYALMPLKIFCTILYFFTMSNIPTHFYAGAFAQFSLFFALFDSFFAINQSFHHHFALYCLKRRFCQ